MLAATELNLTAINTHVDPEENFIFVNSQYMGHDLLLGAIYGPNSTSLTSIEEYHISLASTLIVR